MMPGSWYISIKLNNVWRIAKLNYFEKKKNHENCKSKTFLFTSVTFHAMHNTFSERKKEQ